MKSTFSRTFSAVAIMLLAALLLVGVSFRLLVKDYLTDTAVEGLKNDAQVIVELVQAAYAEDPISTHDFSIALTVASSVSGVEKRWYCKPIVSILAPLRMARSSCMKLQSRL